MSKFLYCLVTDRSQYRQPLHEVAELAEESGVDYFQLRQKDLRPSELFQLARHIRPMLSRTRLIINGQLDVAIAAEADGIHLQKTNLPVSIVRKRFPHLIIGYSAHSKDELAHAEESGVSYLFLSPIFETPFKNSHSSPLGYTKFASWIKGIRVPVFALGGIDRSNIGHLPKTGCAGAAGIRLFINNGEFSNAGMVIR